MLRPELLPGICTEAVLAGRASDALAALAGEPAGHHDPVEARALFQKGMHGPGRHEPTLREAAGLPVERAAAAALSGRSSPHEALSRIVRTTRSGSRRHLREPKLDQEALMALLAYLNEQPA